MVTLTRRGDSQPKLAQNTSASGAAATVTLAADRQRSHSLTAIHLTYDGGTPGIKAITISYTHNTASVTVVIGVNATALATNIVELNGRITGDVNTAITVTGALLASQVAQLDVFYE